MKKKKLKYWILASFVLIIVSVAAILPEEKMIKIVLEDDAEPVTMDEEFIEYQIVNRSLRTIHFGASYFVEKNVE